MKKSLSDYCESLSDLVVDISGDVTTGVRFVTNDSRQVKPGALFAAVRGHAEDGRRFIDDAIRNGAVGVVYQDDIGRKLSVPSVRVNSDYEAYARIAECYYDYPGRAMKIVGITGTNGKSTTAFLIRDIIRRASVKCGLIGTVCYDTGRRTIPAERTTPDAMMLQSLLSEMRGAGVEVVVLEISSHALSQNRLGSLQVDVAVFTNLTTDHLDYYDDIEEYFGAKKLLFDRQLKPGGAAVVNGDDLFGRRLIGMLNYHGTVGRAMDWEPAEFGGKRAMSNGIRLAVADATGTKLLTVSGAPKHQGVVWTYGLRRTSDYHPIHVNFTLDKSSIIVDTPCGVMDLQYSLTGSYNALNVMAAVATATAIGIPLPTIEDGVRLFAGVPGRLERVRGRQSPNIFVDYAHTEDALKNVLCTLKQLNPGKLVVVFGCGGDRDPTKRAKMGSVASELADEIILTSDNPRSESPEAIINEIAGGIEGGRPYRVVTDRYAAIKLSIQEARTDDTVLIAGKGHEEYQEVNGEKRFFNDALTVRNILSAIN